MDRVLVRLLGRLLDDAHLHLNRAVVLVGQDSDGSRVTLGLPPPEQPSRNKDRSDGAQVGFV